MLITALYPDGITFVVPLEDGGAVKEGGSGAIASGEQFFYVDSFGKDVRLGGEGYLSPFAGDISDGEV